MTAAREPASAQLGVDALRVDRRLLLCGETALAALLSLLALGHRSFSLDESVSVTIAKLDWSSFAAEVNAREGNMSLYHLLLSGWIAIGDSEFTVRSLSVIAGVATVPAAYLFAKRLAGVRAALIAGLLLALNPMFVRYAQEARSYELSLLLVTVASYLFVRGLEQPSWSVWVTYAVVTALAGYAHFFALLVPLGHATSLLFVRRELVPWRKLIGSACLLGLLLLFLLYLLASNETSGIEWAAGNPIGRIFTKIHDRPQLAAAALVGGAAVLLIGWWALVRRLGPRLKSRETWTWSFLLAWILVPVAVVAVIGVLYRPLFVARYFIVCLPPVVLLVSLLAARIRRARLASASVAALAAASLAGVVGWYAVGEKEDWRGATRYVVRAAGPGDGVLFYAPYARIPFAFYDDETDEAGRTALKPVYPADSWSVNAIQFNKFVPISPNNVRAASARLRRVWLVLSHVALFGRADPRYDAVLEGLGRAGLRETGSRSFAGIRIVRYESRS